MFRKSVWTALSSNRITQPAIKLPTQTLSLAIIIEHVEWPAQWADLNPIEHLWGLLKRKVKRHIINSKTKLKESLEPRMQRYKTNKLESFLPKRITAVIKAMGGPTKYNLWKFNLF